jgi:hypothetical protein
MEQSAEAAAGRRNSSFRHSRGMIGTIGVSAERHTARLLASGVVGSSKLVVGVDARRALAHGQRPRERGHQRLHIQPNRQRKPIIMSALESKPHVQHKLRSASGSVLTALGALIAIAISVLALALTGANRTIPVRSATHPHRASSYPRPRHYRGTGVCHAVLNPIPGQLHGGCAIATSTAGTPTPAP